MARTIITLTAPLFYIFFALLSQQSMSQPEHMYTFCNPIENFTQTSPYETNRNNLLTSFRESSSIGPYLTTSIGLSPDTIHGMFLCRGDINATSCSDSIRTATTEIASNCTLNKVAVIYYEECMVRYSNVSFFSLLEIRPNIVLYDILPAPNSNRFNQTLSDKFEQLLLDVSPTSLIPYFVTNQERVTQSEGSYILESMLQCSPDLDSFNCTVCLRVAFLRVSSCCGLPSSSQIFTPKCLIRYTTLVLPSTPSSRSPPPPQVSPPPSPSPQVPAQSSPPPSLPQSPQPPPPLLFTPPRTVPNSSGSFSFNAIKGNEIFGRIIVAMTALVFALVDL